ncbi:tryptophan synthase subunit alpha [candidate division KSB1 bacterium]|nr:MAG: tryptophan synthase subunit alpha [candidate division KSB1 bacterium]
MNRITHTIETARRNQHKLLSIFITAGYPHLELTVPLVLEAAKNGADMIEIGIPFSDPLADGPTIQQSSQVALEQGITLTQIFDLVSDIRRQSPVPLILMGYINPILQFGYKEFLAKAAEIGVDGLIVPDLPPEEAGELKSLCQQFSLSNIFLISPNTPSERIRYIGELSTDFVYCVSVTGVTGARKGINPNLLKFLRHVRELITKPFLVGFGIATPEDAQNISRHCDGVIVGSAFIDLIRNNANKSELELLTSVAKYIRNLKSSISGVTDGY